MAWLIRVVRITIFPASDLGGWQPRTWRDLLGQDPENQFTPSPGARIENGSFGRGRLQLQRRQAPAPRADLLYNAWPEEPGTSLGTFDEAMATILPVGRALLDGGLRIGRLALGTDHFEQTPGIPEAIRLLSERIDPQRFDLSDAYDFAYQINRRTESATVPGLGINRLGKWALVRWQSMEINLPSGVTTTGEEAIGAHLQTDINTVEGYADALPTNSLVSLLDELAHHTVQLATRGDVR